MIINTANLSPKDKIKIWSDYAPFVADPSYHPGRGYVQEYYFEVVPYGTDEEIAIIEQNVDLDEIVGDSYSTEEDIHQRIRWSEEQFQEQGAHPVLQELSKHLEVMTEPA